jgi:hypothetical protein
MPKKGPRTGARGRAEAMCATDPPGCWGSMPAYATASYSTKGRMPPSCSAISAMPATTAAGSRARTRIPMRSSARPGGRRFKNPPCSSPLLLGITGSRSCRRPRGLQEGAGRQAGG